MKLWRTGYRWDSEEVLAHCELEIMTREHVDLLPRSGRSGLTARHTLAKERPPA